MKSIKRKRRVIHKCEIIQSGNSYYIQFIIHTAIRIYYKPFNYTHYLTLVCLYKCNFQSLSIPVLTYLHITLNTFTAENI